jgi:hypothetical protein
MAEQRHCRKWSAEEDQVLLRYVKARPQNLHYCFVAVAEQIGRTEGAVANRWYGKVSKDPSNVCFFTASPKHVSKNRKNGMGVETNNSIWRRLMNIIRGL